MEKEAEEGNGEFPEESRPDDQVVMTAAEDDDDDQQQQEDDEETAPQNKKSSGRFSQEFLNKAEDFTAKLRKRGVVYVARIPPRMTPTKIKSLLSGFGCEVTRVYLAEEDKTVRERRKKLGGGSGSKRYTEGWVEFARKRVAKHVAQSLNNTPISNHKRNVHYGDLWNVKYLHRFKWSHLTEKVAYERRVREQKLRVEMMQARRENASYVELVETGKKLDKIEERRRKRQGDDDVNIGNPEKSDGGKKKRKRQRQIKPLKDGSDRAATSALLGSLV